MQIAALLFLAIGFCYWSYQLVTLVRVARRVPLLHLLPEGERSAWPRVSVILTACNEEASLEEALRARLEEDYPNLELILVEDRSTDGTLAIARRMAERDARLKVVPITELPAGWLGKLNALEQGRAAATGEWLVFSDADVAVHKGTLRRMVTYCEARQLDHCVMLPRLRPVHPLLDCLTSLFMRLVALNLRVWAIEDPRSKASVGAGAFNLVRREALARTPGFAWLKMEVADDLSLGQMLKAAGARPSVVNGRGLASLCFHRSLGEAFRSAERATYTAIGNFSLTRLATIAAAAVALELSPLFALALARTPLMQAAGVTLLAICLAALLVSNRFWARSSWNLVLLPVVELLAAYSQVRSGVLGKLRGGIVWRGTFYANAELKAGRRFGGAGR